MSRSETRQSEFRRLAVQYIRTHCPARPLFRFSVGDNEEQPVLRCRLGDMTLSLLDKSLVVSTVGVIWADAYGGPIRGMHSDHWEVHLKTLRDAMILERLADV